MQTSYEKDVVAWAIEPAHLLRSGQLSAFDIEHIAEEIEDVGKSEQRELASRLEVFLTHLLTWQYQPAYQGKSCLATIKEQRFFDKLKEHGLSPRRKLLFVGPPGTGKTMTAAALAGELGVPLFLVRLDSLITKYMGETAAKLRQVFDAITEVRGIYFFDEFDFQCRNNSRHKRTERILRVLSRLSFERAAFGRS